MQWLAVPQVAKPHYNACPGNFGQTQKIEDVCSPNTSTCKAITLTETNNKVVVPTDPKAGCPYADSSSICSGVACPACGPDEVIVPIPGACCGVCIRPVGASGACPAGTVSTPIDSGVKCVVSTSMNCDTSSCPISQCPTGQRAITPAGECCIKCVNDVSTTCETVKASSST